MYGDVFILESDGLPDRKADRLGFGETAGRNEAWLRDKLFDVPGILPVQALDPSFGPLVPLCRELRTDAGPLDIAFINEFGKLTLVECKLWRNPEARRKVVAQALDYARAIAGWTYSDLQSAVCKALGSKGNIPFLLVKAQHPEIKEQDFVDMVSSSMKQGKFLIVIAGDGIRDDIEAITGLINRNASAFTFGLVEVALYGFEDGTILVQPRVQVKTRLIEKTVVIVRDAAGTQIVVKTDDDLGLDSQTSGVQPANALGETGKPAEYRAWWTPVIEASYTDPDQEAPRLFYPNYVRVPLPKDFVWIHAFRSGGDKGNLAVCLLGKGQDFNELHSIMEATKEQILGELPIGSAWGHQCTGNEDRFETVVKASSFNSEDEKRKWFISVIDSYSLVFRSRIDRFAKQYEG